MVSQFCQLDCAEAQLTTPVQNSTDNMSGNPVVICLLTDVSIAAIMATAKQKGSLYLWLAHQPAIGIWCNHFLLFLAGLTDVGAGGFFL